MDKIQMLELRLAALESRLALAEAMIEENRELATAAVGREPPPSIMSKLVGMTRRQFGTLCLVMAGKENDEIARMLDCTDSTAKTTARRAMLNLGVSTRGDLFAQFFDDWQRLDDAEVVKVFGFSKDFGAFWQEQPEALAMVRGQ